MNPTAAAPEISVVAPVYNEEKVLQMFYDRTSAALKQNTGQYEIIFVDDGSSDQTLPMLRIIAAQDTHVRVLSFSRNFGHQTAVSAGLEYSRGQGVMVIDADLQDPPELITRFVEAWKEGYEVLYAVREKRKEDIFRRSAYFIFYRFLRSVATIDIPLDSGDFCFMDRKVVDTIVGMPEKNRFIRGLRVWSGFRQKGVTYERQERAAGPSHYTFGKLVKLAFDGITSFSTAPLRLASYLGFVIALFSFGEIAYALFAKYYLRIKLEGWTTIVVLCSFIGGIQLIILGVIGEYIGRIYVEVQNRPLYILKEKIGL